MKILATRLRRDWEVTEVVGEEAIEIQSNGGKSGK